MASIISAGTTSGTALNMAGDTSGVLQLATNGSTTALTIDTSQRAAFVAGTAALPAITTTGDTNTGIFFPAADTIAFAEGGAEAMRIDSSGNVLVGTTTVLGSAKATFAASAAATVVSVKAGGNGNAGIEFYNTSSVSQGYIVINASSVQYLSVSDYRLKENVVPMTGALDKIAQLKPVTYTWKQDGTNGQGFIAHELQEVVPDCVSGKKDAVDEEGNPIHQGIDTSFLVATLTAAIQEQQTIINDLKARITALEGASL